MAFASNGEEALKVYREFNDAKTPIDLAIFDLTVQAGMGGRKALEKLRKINPGIKAIASSGY